MIGAIENAILARLKAASDADVLGYHWQTLETFPEDWAARLAEELGTVRTPAAWVVFAGWSPDPRYQDAIPAYVVGRFAVIVMAENMRNEEATRHGGTASEPGSYQMALDVAGLLGGHNLGLDISSLKVGALQFVNRPEAALKRKCSMLGVEFTTTFAAPDSPMLSSGLTDFESFHVNWELPPHGRVDADPAQPGVQLPDDPHADATDHQILET